MAKVRFEANCLEEYAERFHTVCVDAGYYRFPDERYIAKLAGQVPDGFRLSFKATDEVTIKNFPNQPRHGDRAGRPNENFLNALLFTEAFLGPLSPFRDKVGVIMSEFSRFHLSDFGHGRDFVGALDRFLGQLPKDWQFGVEIRNSTFLQPEYFGMLASRLGVSSVKAASAFVFESQAFFYEVRPQLLDSRERPRHISCIIHDVCHYL